MSLRLHTPCSPRDRASSTFFASQFRFNSPTPAPFRRKCSIQSALPDVATSLCNGLSASTHLNMIKLYDSVFQRTSELGLSLFSQEATSWSWAIVAPMAFSYLFATPGSLAGLADYIYAPIHARSLRSFTSEDVEIGRQLGEGSFGVVYEGFIGGGKAGSKAKGLHVVLKKAKTRVKGASEIHNSEIHMNFRLQRTAPFSCAEFLGTLQVKPAHARGKLSEGVWLVWNFQGDRSLDYYLKQKDFPQNLVSMVLGKGASKEEISDWNTAVIKTIFKQILTNLQDLHRSGVVHRDVKPLNLILDQNSGKFKLIDFGACVDLRSGFNYVPNETVIDPTYAAPEHYVMPTSTPNLPPDPLCSLVSPLLWHLNTPDRFDLYSAGLILMQLSMKSLRHDTGMQAFNNELKRNGYNLKKWRASCRHGKDEFALLDADGGAGWELVTALLQPRHDKDQLIWPSLGGSRPSAPAALRHRFLHNSIALPKIFPQELADPASHLLPAFEGVAQSLSSVARKVVYSSPKNIDGLTLDHQNEKKVQAKASSFHSIPSIPFVPSAAPLGKQSNGGRDMRSKGDELFAGTPHTPNLSLVSLFDSQILPSTSAVKENLSRSIQGALKGVPGKVETLRRSESTSEVEISSKQQEGSPTHSGAIRNGSVFSPVGVALPTLTSAIALATGWLALSGLNSSAQASYEFGKLLMSSSSVSGSAFLAFFLVIKPWLEEHNISLGKAEDSRVPILDELQVNAQLDKYRFNHPENIKVQVVVDAMQELDLHMSVLESQLLEEKQASQQQKELVQKLESLLLQPLTNKSMLQREGEEDCTFISQS